MKYRRISVIIVCVVVLLLVAALFAYLLLSPQDIIYSTNVADYNTTDFPMPSEVFPTLVPENAEIISFSYYHFWSEDEDYYLELKFSSAEELEQYLSATIESCNEYCMRNYSNAVEQWFLEEKNPYNVTYTDLFNICFASYSQNKSYTGYKITENNSYICNYGIISYSYADLTVIHTRAAGSFHGDDNNHVPQYIARFDIPIDSLHLRTLECQSGNGSKPLK